MLEEYTKKMEKITYDRDNYFVGKNGIYLELQNTKEYIDEDGIKRVVVELKDPNKILKVLDLKKRKEKREPIEIVFEETAEDKQMEIPDIL